MSLVLHPERVRHEGVAHAPIARPARGPPRLQHQEPLIGADARPGLLAYLAGALNAIRDPALEVGGVADHVHILFLLSKNVALSAAVEELKKESSKWAKLRVHPGFYWQGGYGAFSVSASNEEKVAAYIANQEQHHATMAFEDELRELLRRHKTEWQEDYLFG